MLLEALDIIEADENIEVDKIFIEMRIQGRRIVAGLLIINRSSICQ